MARLALLVAALMSFAGCVSSRSFLPTEHVTGFSPRGSYYAAEYPILEGGQSLGEVRVWTSGAVRDASDDDPRTTVRVGFELENHGESTIRLDEKRLYLEEMREAGVAGGRVPLTHLDGEALVPPGQTRQIEVAFELPSSVWPSDVPGFRVAWSVVGERVHSRKTPFLRELRTGAGNPWSPYYGPYSSWYYPGLYYGYPGFYGAWPRYGGWPVPWNGPRIYRGPRYLLPR